MLTMFQKFIFMLIFVAWLCIATFHMVQRCTKNLLTCNCKCFDTNTFCCSGWLDIWHFADHGIFIHVLTEYCTIHHILAIRFNQYKPCCTILEYNIFYNFVVMILVSIGASGLTYEGSSCRLSHNALLKGIK